jgi:hypothetical protein
MWKEAILVYCKKRSKHVPTMPTKAVLSIQNSLSQEYKFESETSTRQNHCIATFGPVRRVSVVRAASVWRRPNYFLALLPLRMHRSLSPCPLHEFMVQGVNYPTTVASCFLRQVKSGPRLRMSGARTKISNSRKLTSWNCEKWAPNPSYIIPTCEAPVTKDRKRPGCRGLPCCACSIWWAADLEATHCLTVLP